MKVTVTTCASLLLTASAWSCSCTIKDPLEPDDDWAWEVLHKAEHVVLGHVTEVWPGNRARISIAVSLKGAKDQITLVGLQAPESMCGTRFTLGEEFIYVVAKARPLILCGKLKASTSMQSAVTKMLAAPRPQPK